MRKKHSTEVLTVVNKIHIKLDWIQARRLSEPNRWYTEMYTVGLYHENGEPINIFEYGERECGGQFAYRIKDFVAECPEAEALKAALHRLRLLRRMIEDGIRV